MSKIPEGATHKATNFYYRRLGPTWQLYTVQGWDATACDWGWLEKNAEPIEPQNPTWNGPEDGLPPVGLECEYGSDSGGWQKIKVLAHTRVGGTAAVGQAGDMGQICMGVAQYWRPIRTAEQLAAEKHRAKYMPQLIKLWDADTGRTEFLEAVYAMIAEAGKP